MLADRGAPTLRQRGQGLSLSGPVHVRVSVVIDLLPDAARLLLERLILLCVAAFGAVMIDAGWDLVERNLDLAGDALPAGAALRGGAGCGGQGATADSDRQGRSARS